MGKKLTQEEFIQKARHLHGDKYDYSHVNYVNYNTPICIICPIHGEFWQLPSNHIHKTHPRGCAKCHGGILYDEKQYFKTVKIIHHNKYDYSQTDLRKRDEKGRICIICPIHGEFWQLPHLHLKGCGCPICANVKLNNTKDFIFKSQQIHGDKYDYSKVEYKNVSEKVCIICPKHGEFWQIPNSHLMGHGCPKCHVSTLEQNVMKSLKENNIQFIYNVTKTYVPFLKNFTLDFYLPQYNIAIECQGIQHFKEITFFEKTKYNFKWRINNDKIKKQLCEQNNIKLFYYSTLNIKYPYKVETDINQLITNIKINHMINIIQQIQTQVESYLIQCNIKSLIIGVSGGLDSGINCALLKPICDKLHIPLIGRYIHIETNKEEEFIRAKTIGETFCHDYRSIDLTPLYLQTLNTIEENDSYDNEDKNIKIRRGNIKARIRMTYLYNLAAEYKGIVIDNDNQTEHLLGFWTINGDVGDITPLFGLFKTEVYELAKCYKDLLTDENAQKALQAVIDAVPTDGLGITNSDVEQFGVSSYNEVDDILMNVKYNCHPKMKNELIEKYGEGVVSKIMTRHKNSDFKRCHPYRIYVTSGKEKWWEKTNKA